MPLDKIRPARIVQWIQPIDCQEDLTLRYRWAKTKPTDVLSRVNPFRTGRCCYRMHQQASTKAVEFCAFGYVTAEFASHNSVDIARSIQAWAHLMYGIRMVQKRRTR
jgi:hypothetical protein